MENMVKKLLDIEAPDMFGKKNKGDARFQAAKKVRETLNTMTPISEE
jgi:hypothetical protein